MTDPRSAPAPAPQIGLVDAVRFLCELFAIVSLAIWGFAAWPVPLNIAAGIIAPVIAIVLWGLFRSPRAVFTVDIYLKGLIELVVMLGAAFAWWAMGHLLIGGIFAVIAVGQGVIVGRRELR